MSPHSLIVHNDSSLEEFTLQGICNIKKEGKYIFNKCVTGNKREVKKQNQPTSTYMKHQQILADENERKRRNLEEKELKRQEVAVRCEATKLETIHEKKAKRAEVASRKEKAKEEAKKLAIETFNNVLAAQDIVGEADKVVMKRAREKTMVEKQVKQKISHDDAVITPSVRVVAEFNPFQFSPIKMALPPLNAVEREASCVKLQSVVRMFIAMKKAVHLMLPLVGACPQDMSVVNQLAFLRIRRGRIVKHADCIVSIAYARVKLKVEEEKMRLESNAFQTAASTKIQKWFQRRMENNVLMKNHRICHTLHLHQQLVCEDPIVEEASEEVGCEEPTSDFYRKAVIMGMRAFVYVVTRRL